MKWSSRRPRRIDYSQIAIVLIVAVLVTLFVMLLSLLAPRPATAGDVTNFRTARRMAAVALPVDKVTTRASEPIKVLYMECTAYAPIVAECDADPFTTASGQKVRVGGVAADWRVLPRGSIITIDGYNGGKPCTVIDQGGAIKGLKLDVFYWHESEAVHWGRRCNVRVQVLYIPKEKP
jgi:3D (Asp-Asp-Asp) domain-containing protein